MLEIHYYFTPLLDSFERFDAYDWYLHPVVNLARAKAFRDAQRLPKNVETLNACFDRLQKITLDYLTVTLQGRKQGRQFLLLLQEELAPEQLLSYNDQFRHKILQEIGLTSTEFKRFRAFSRQELQAALEDFQQQHFASCPASLVFTTETTLQFPACSHAQLQNYLHQIDKTA